MHSTAWYGRVKALITVGDAVAIGITLVAAYFIRFGDTNPRVWSSADSATVGYEQVGLLIGLVWMISLAANRSRQSTILAQGLVEYHRAASATLLTFGNAAIVAYLLQVTLSRQYFLVALPLGIVLVVANRWVMRQYLRHARSEGRFQDRALVVGRLEDVHRVQRELRRTSAAGIAPESAYYVDSADDVAPAARSTLVARANAEDVDLVIIAGELPGGADAVRRLSWDLERTRADLVLASRLTDIAGPRIHLRPIPGIPLVHVSLPRFTGWSYVVKRAMDVVLSAVALLVLSPVFLVVAAAIKLDDGGPVFFRQTRTGTNGEPFHMLKFRSMRTDAEQVKSELMTANEGAGPLFKMKADPRVTRVGRVLRAYSLDELPQFVNTLRGSMSVVGPRPPLPNEVAQYDNAAHRRLLIKPGITGLWQVSGRSNLSWEDSLRLDLSYVENWSPVGDLAIVARTAIAVVRREGAY